VFLHPTSFCLPTALVCCAQVQQQQTAALVSALGPLLLPYFKEKKLRRILLEEAASRAGELAGTRSVLFEQLEACLPAGGPAGAGAHLVKYLHP
jgi:hypothetical protein